MTTRSLPQCIIKISGTQASEELMDDLLEVVVDSSLHVPSMFTFQLRDPKLKWVDDALVAIGKEVEIETQQGEERGGATGTLIKGEITALEPSFSAEGDTSLIVRGYDKSHRLHHGKKTRTFLEQKDSGLAQTIAGEAGLTPEVDATTVTHDYVLQNNQTNMEFLLARAERIGYQVSVADGKLYFKKGDASQGDGPTLKLGETLRSFRPCWTTAHQADKMIVKGWDPKGKTAITSTKTPSASLNQGGMTEPGGDTAKTAFVAAEAVVSDSPVFTVDEAAAMATGLSNDISRQFVQAEGSCSGNPKVLAGWKVTIEGVGTRFSGTYFVTSATHIYNSSGYETAFTITGRQPNTLSHLLLSGSDHGGGRMQGVVTGMVTNLDDPDNLGRVKVKYTWLGDIESDWIRIATPMAGPERGFYYLPEINDEVLVAYEHGDVHRPYIVGMLWSSTDKPPAPNSEATSGGKVNQRIIKSRSGHTVILDDTDGAEQIIIRDKTESNEIVIDSAENSMTLNCDGDFTVVAKGKISLTSTEDMLLETKANGEIKAQGNQKMTITGNLDAKATGNATVKGLKLALEGTTQSELKGLTVSVSGSTMTEVKGALVKIN